MKGNTAMRILHVVDMIEHKWTGWTYPEDLPNGNEMSESTLYHGMAIRFSAPVQRLNTKDCPWLNDCVNMYESTFQRMCR